MTAPEPWTSLGDGAGRRWQMRRCDVRVSAALSGLAAVWDGNPGRRSRPRFALGYSRSPRWGWAVSHGSTGVAFPVLGWRRPCEGTKGTDRTQIWRGAWACFATVIDCRSFFVKIQSARAPTGARGGARAPRKGRLMQVGRFRRRDADGCGREVRTTVSWPAERAVRAPQAGRMGATQGGGRGVTGGERGTSLGGNGTLIEFAFENKGDAASCAPESFIILNDPLSNVSDGLPESRRFLPAMLLLFVGSGCAALIYEIVWLQLLQLVIGLTTISLGVLLGAYMGGMCLGSLALARIIPERLGS